MVRVSAGTAQVAAVVVAVAAGVGLAMTGSSSSASGGLRYSTAAATVTTVADQVSATGSVQAASTLDLAFGSSGLPVTAVYVHAGETVAAGQVLATVDPTAADAQLASAKAQLSVAQAQAAAATASPTPSPTPTARTAATATACPPTTGSASTAPAPSPSTSSTASPSPTPSAPSGPTGGRTGGGGFRRPGPAASSSPSPSPSPSPSASTSPSPSTSPSTGSGPTAGGTLGTLATAGSTAGHTTASCSPSGSTSSGGTRTQTASSPSGGSGGSGGGGGATSLVTAQQQVSQAQAAVAATSLTAPQAGVVESVNLVVGTLPGSPAVVLHATGYQVAVDVAEQDAPFVRVGQTGQATFPALGVSGEVTVVQGPISGSQASSTAGASVVTFPVLLGLPNPPPGLLPGMSAQVSWTAASRTGVLAVPTSAIRSGDTGDVVLAIVDGRSQTEPVTVGLSTTSLTQVVSGLQAGERVVTGVSG